MEVLLNGMSLHLLLLFLFFLLFQSVQDESLQLNVLTNTKDILDQQDNYDLEVEVHPSDLTKANGFLNIAKTQSRIGASFDEDVRVRTAVLHSQDFLF
jgi:hypothetical protein